MLTLRVTSLNGNAPPQPITATFDEAGGTIGRAEGNHLVLPDEHRHISRLHARIAFVAGGFELVGQGSNPIDVNGVAVGNGASVRLQIGDQLQIGGYAVVVEGAGRQPPKHPRAADPTDPFAGLSAPSSLDPLGLGFGQPAAPVAAPSVASAPPSSGFSAIPDDFDPFADPFAPPLAAPPPSAEPFDLGTGRPGSAAQSLDTLFDLPQQASSDPFGTGALSQPLAPGNAPAPVSLDPLAPWQDAAPPAPAPVADRVAEIHGSFKPPVARRELPPSAPPTAPAQIAGDIFLSWDESAPPADPAPPKPPAAPSAAAATVPSPAAADPLLGLFDDAAPTSASADPLGLGTPPPDALLAAEPLEVTRVMPSPARPAASIAPERTPAAPASRAAPAVAAPPAAPAHPADRDALARAFLTGLGAPQLPINALTPELAERIGQLLREATQGTLDLLMARAMTKREVRAEATMIVSRDNNPLKFSPDATVALTHLLAPHGSGFMPPVAAMRDAYDDLRSHQFGFMAGLRSALAGVLKRFDPGVLEQRLAEKSMLDSVLPMNRRAKLWDLYERLYREIATEAEDDFHTLFGREFLRAYEEQVAKLGSREDAAR